MTLFSSMGLDLTKGAVRNNLEAGVIEPAMSKVKIIQVKVMNNTKPMTNVSKVWFHDPLTLFPNIF